MKAAAQLALDFFMRPIEPPKPLSFWQSQDERFIALLAEFGIAIDSSRAKR